MTGKEKSCFSTRSRSRRWSLTLHPINQGQAISGEVEKGLQKAQHLCVLWAIKHFPKAPTLQQIGQLRRKKKIKKKKRKRNSDLLGIRWHILSHQKHSFLFVSWVSSVKKKLTKLVLFHSHLPPPNFFFPWPKLFTTLDTNQPL